MSNSRIKEILLDCTFSVGFGLFLIFHTHFHTIDFTWFVVLFIFNILLELHKAAYRVILQERESEKD